MYGSSNFFSLQKNLKLIDKIRKYQEFFDDYEKRRKYDQKYAKQMKARVGWVQRAGGGIDGGFHLTFDDMRLGRKLDRIDRFNKKNTNMKEAKVNYFKNLKPFTGNFKRQQMDPNQQVIQEAHDRNREYLEANKYRKLMTPKT